MKPVQQWYEEIRGQLISERRSPLATYRLQFHKDFRFEDANAHLPYLKALGVTDLYASPYLRAMPGSLHGYDVIDHSSLNPEIGSPEEHERFCSRLLELGLGQLLDVVPNHMGIERFNPLWFDVLENGPSSVFAKFFDIDWSPIKEELKDKILLPILGDQYGLALERGELKLSFEQGALAVHYYDHTFPIGLPGYASFLRSGLPDLQKRLPDDDPLLIELESILTAIDHLPRHTETAPPKVAERNREKEVIKRRLAAIAQSSPISSWLAERLTHYNGDPSRPESFDPLDQLLSSCCYRLAHWRVAGEEINYRRFFDINSLAAIRVEDPDVFEEAHRLPLAFLAERKVTGLRIDHPDGLFDPTAYFDRLQRRYFLQRAKIILEGRTEPLEWNAIEAELDAIRQRELENDPHTPLRRLLYLVVEKIQGGRERIPDAWAIDGTVGYRFANVASGLFVDRSNEAKITEAYERFVGARLEFASLLYDKKKLVLSMSMSSEVNVLARELNRISEMNRRTRDFTLNSLRRALVELVALFPVYRTYLDGQRPELDPRDVRYVESTITIAKEKDLGLDPSIFDFIKDVLLRRTPTASESQRAAMLRFAMKLQQLTGPVMAKGMEDTVFYVYNRLVSLNEVGGEPERFGTEISTFHLRNQERIEYWPAALLASSTHDTKRSEDVRARINVLSELPDDWRTHLRKWSKWNLRHKGLVRGELAPVPNDEYLFYQNLLGAWPMEDSLSPSEWIAFAARMSDYLLKAIKEAKTHTSWVNPDASYEAAAARFVESALDPKRSAAFLKDAHELKRRIQRPGQINALSQLLLKVVSPGVPDFYQGCELWSLCLVDPDNRRPVDFDLRERLLTELDERANADRLGLCRALFESMDDGRIKLYATSAGLRLRKRRAELFRTGGYLPLDVEGQRARHAIAFSRFAQDQEVIAIAPRLVALLLEKGTLEKGLAGTFVRLPAESAGKVYRDVFTGREVRAPADSAQVTLDLGKLFSDFPLALLEST